MKKKLIAALSAFMTVMCAAPINTVAASFSPVETEHRLVGSVNEVNAERVAALVNKYRRDNGLSELKLCSALTRAAAARAEELAVSFSHTRPNGQSFSSIVVDYHIPWSKTAENAAYGQTTPESAVKSWIDSESHRKNLLNPDYNYIGVGLFYSNGVCYWDQIYVQTKEEMAGTRAPRNYGDANNNGVLDGVDASFVLSDYARVSVGKASQMNERQRELADMNSDGIINGVDASAILTAYAKSSIS